MQSTNWLDKTAICASWFFSSMKVKGGKNEGIGSSELLGPFYLIISTSNTEEWLPEGLGQWVLPDNMPVLVSPMNTKSPNEANPRLCLKAQVSFSFPEAHCHLPNLLNIMYYLPPTQQDIFWWIPTCNQIPVLPVIF